MSPKLLAEKYLLGAPCWLLGLAIQQCGGRSDGRFAGQALGMGRRVLLRQRGTEFGTLEYNFGYIGIRRLGEIRCVWTAQTAEPKATAGRPRLQCGDVALRLVMAAVVTNGTTQITMPRP